MVPRPSTSASVLLAVRVWFWAAVPVMTTVPVGASFTATPVKLLLPVTGAAMPSDTLVVMLKLALNWLLA